MEEIQALAFFDLDGTLLNATASVDPEVADAMIQLKKNHVLPIIATGRTIMEITPVMSASQIDSAIVMNGQYIQIDGKQLYSNLFSDDECMKMYEKIRSQGDELAYYNRDHIWCTGHSPALIKSYSHFHSNGLPTIDPFIFKNEPINMLLILTEDNDEYYYEQFPELTFFRNSPYSIDTVKKGVNKGFGVQKTVENLKLPDVPTFGFGDGLNDIDLLNACDYKIAMGNAIPELKELATYVTGKNTEGGLLQALKHYQLI